MNKMYVLVGQSYDEACVIAVSESSEKIEQKKKEYEELYARLQDYNKFVHAKFPWARTTEENIIIIDNIKKYKEENPPPTQEYMYPWTFTQEAELI
jgi:hypothetical protein